MQTKLLFTAFLLVLMANLAAQTKWIAHKSHSGSAADFDLVTPNSPFDDDGSNFGHAPQPDVVTAQLDSVIFLSDSVSVMVTCLSSGAYRNRHKNLWQPGRDTILHHPLFSGGYSLAEIKRQLKTFYHFSNPIENVVFIGYDRVYKKPPPPPKQNQQQNQNQQQPQGQQPPQQGQQRQNNVSPVLPGNAPQQPPFGFSIGWMVAIMGCCAIAVGFLSWLHARSKIHEKLA